jgi:beta-phosphoglucomutase
MLSDSAPASSILKRPKAILFDHDGVLVSSEELHFAAWREFLSAELHIDTSTLNFHSVVGQTAPQILRFILDTYRPGWTEAEYPLDALSLRKNDYYLKIARTGLAVYPGVIEGLKWLKKEGILAAVVSNAKRREIDFSMTTLKLGSYFDVLLSRDDVPRPKPDPSAFQTGADHLGFHPNECIAIDDSPTGLQSALLAGIPSATVTTNYPAEILESPVPGRPDLRPIWIGKSMLDFFLWLKSLPTA